MMQPSLLIRADAFHGLGSGHIMRMLALGQGWKDAGGRVVFATNASAESLISRLRSEGFCVVSINEPYPHAGDTQLTLALAQQENCQCIVLDGYHFDVHYQRALRQQGYFVVLIEDMNQHPVYEPDILLVSGVDAADYGFTCASWTQCLFGPKYALLRREFLTTVRKKAPQYSFSPRILITFGGEDRPNATGLVLQALISMACTWPITVILGTLNLHRASLESLVATSSCDIRLLPAQNNMQQWLSEADILIGAGGITCWEAFYYGVPVFALAIAENQVPVLKSLAQIRALDYYAHSLDKDIDLLNEALRKFLYNAQFLQEMSIRAKQLVDGQGTQHLIHAIGEKSHVTKALTY